MQASVEILLATYNGEKYLRVQLESLRSQTWTDWHLTISDDGSTDSTSALLDAYAAQYPDKMTRVYAKKRFGNARDHFFWLIQQCHAPYMLFCDQDDVWNADKVEKTMQAMLNAESLYSKQVPILVFTDLTPVDEQLCPLSPSLMRMQKQRLDGFDYQSLLLQNVVTGCATGINHALARLAEQCTDTSAVIMHDWWLGLVASRFGRLVYLNESTICYRQHSANSVGAKRVGSIGYIWNTLTQANAARQAILRKKKQAATFAAQYGAALTAEEQAFLRTFSAPRSGFRFYWHNRRRINGFWRRIGFFIWG